MEREFMILVLRLLRVILWRMVYSYHGNDTDKLHGNLLSEAENYIRKIEGGQ